MDQEVISILLVDDHPLILDGLEQLFRMESRFEIVGRCNQADEAIATIQETRPRLVVLDLRLSASSGLEVLARTAELTSIILLTGALDDDELHEALDLGARAVILKERAPELLLECIERVVEGERWIDPDLIQRVLRKVDRIQKREEAGRILSPRELEITRLVGQGLRNKEIASTLSISEGTVKTHLRSIFEKVGVDNRVALVLWARHRAVDA